MKAVFSSGANRDIRETLQYYRREAGADVAADFHLELQALVVLIKQWPESSPLIHEDLRRAMMKRFPFQLVYRIESQIRIRILAVRHHSRLTDFGLDR